MISVTTQEQIQQLKIMLDRMANEWTTRLATPEEIRIMRRLLDEIASSVRKAREARRDRDSKKRAVHYAPTRGVPLCGAGTAIIVTTLDEFLADTHRMCRHCYSAARRARSAVGGIKHASHG